jgi:hypothetical protein
VWVSRDEVMGPMNYLVVSSDAYNVAFGDRRSSQLRSTPGHPGRHAAVAEKIRELIGN